MKKFLTFPHAMVKTFAALTCATFISPQAFSQPEDADYELITTAIHKRSSETALPVTVISGDELHDQARATLGETLSNQPGINNASFGPGVGQTVIRGQQGRRVLNMTNAVSNADASGNSADHALTVEAILADTIEVLRGPSTLLYGGGAIGGVVNVIDNRIASSLPDSPQFSVEARHDSASDQDNLVGRLEFATGNLVWHLDGVKREWNDMEIPGLAIAPAYLEEEHHEEGEEHEEEHEEHEEPENTDGFIANTGGESEAFTLGTSWIFENGFLGLAVSEYGNLYGLPPGAHAHEEEHEEEHVEGEEEEEHHEEENIMIDMSRSRYDLVGELNELSELNNIFSFFETINYRLSYTDYTHSELEGPGIIGTTFSNESWQQRLQLSHRELSGWHGVLGFQSLDEEFGAVGEESFIPVTDITSHGVFLVEDYHTGNVTIELGARVNRDDYSPQNSIAPDKDFSTLSFSGSALVDVSAPLTLGLSISHSERAPSIEELYSNFGLTNVDECVIHLATASCEIGNTALGEETSLNTDLTVYLDYENYSATFTAFYNDFKDYIFQNNTGTEVDEFAIRTYDQDDARFSGLEVEVLFMLNADWQLRIFGDMIDSHVKNYGDVPRMPPARVGSELRYAAGNWSSFVSFLHAADQEDPGQNELPTSGYTRWDIGADYTLDLSQGELLFFVKGRNLSNEEIRLSTSFLRGFAPESARSIETGLRYRF